MDAFKDVDLVNVFHAYLMHTELVSEGVRGEVTFPPWIMHEAREAWMCQVRYDATVSRDQEKIASIIGELGVPHELERLTNDGYFSVDVYMPNGDVALEFDGPSHFINISINGKGALPGDAPRTWRRTPHTELRDMFLKSRHHTVVCVPWFEWAELRGSAEKRQFVAAKLRAASVHVPASV